MGQFTSGTSEVDAAGEQHRSYWCGAFEWRSALGRIVSCCDQDLPYPIYELTSSSLNQIHPRGTPTENRFRSHVRTCHRENYGVVRIDWDRDNTSVTLEVKDMEGGTRIEKNTDR